MSSTRKIAVIFLALLASAGGTVLLVQAFNGSRAEPEFATVWPMPNPLPEFSLTDQSGEAFGKNKLRGQWSLLFFGFTNCPDICPATLQQLAIANKNLMEAGISVPNIILVSVDPERDTPDILATYISHFSGEILGVTGDITEMKKLASAAGIFFEKSELPDGNYTVDHSAAVLVINKDAAILASFGAPQNITSLVHDLPILMGSN